MFKILVLLVFCSHSFALDIREYLTLVKSNEAYQKALKDIDLFENRIDLATSSVLPSISLISSFTKQNETDFDFIATQQRQTFLNLRQPLFRGLKEFKGIQYAKRLKQTKILAKESVERELHFNFINIYFELLKYQEELKLLKESLSLKNSNLSFITQRQKVGSSKKSDLLSAKAQALKAKVDIKEAQEKYDSLKIELQRLIGKKLDQDLQPYKSLLTKDLNYDILEHPSIKTAKLVYESFDDLIEIEKADHYPSLDLSANYYLDQEGVFNQREWDMAINLNFPIYEGNRTSAQIREQRLAKESAKIDVESIKKDLITLIEKLKLNVLSAKDQMDFLDTSVQASYESYQEIKKDFNLRLSNNLELNNALDAYLQEKRRLIDLKAKAQKSYFQFLSITGNLYATH